MTDRELDALVAVHIMGWVWKTDQNYLVTTGKKVGEPWRFLTPHDGVFQNVTPWNGTPMEWKDNGAFPEHYSTDMNAAFKMEHLLSRKEGLAFIYGDNLATIAQDDWGKESGRIGHAPMNWICAHASPRIRCLAALKTIAPEQFK